MPEQHTLLCTEGQDGIDVLNQDSRLSWFGHVLNGSRQRPRTRVRLARRYPPHKLEIGAVRACARQRDWIGSKLAGHSAPAYRGRVPTVFLVGPTAVGKSAVALEVAEALDAEIVSTDSMQVYRGMDIGTAKPTAAERALMPHHLIDVCEVSDVFDAKQFVELAGKVITDIHSRGKTALVVGGTGLYVRALRHGLFEGPPRNAKLRARLEAMTAPQLFEELQRVDPQTAKVIDRHNPRRLVRALEVFHQTGKPISELQNEWAKDGPENEMSPIVCLNRTREDLHARIERRIDEQIAVGWVGEVRQLLTHGLEKNAIAMQAAGYRRCWVRTSSSLRTWPANCPGQ